MKTKLCALLLAVTMLLAMLSGCGGTTEASSETAASQPVSSAGEVSEPEEPAEAPQETAQAEPAPSAVEESVLESPEEDGIRKYVTPDNIEELIAGRPSVSLPLAEGASLSFWTGSPAMDATITGWNDSTGAQRKAYNQVQQAALNAWNSTREVTRSSFTGLFTLNTEETSTVQQYYTDISTYAAEQIGRFLIGELDIDENWDAFVETIESMGIDQVIAAYESAGERYFGRIA